MEGHIGEDEEPVGVLMVMKMVMATDYDATHQYLASAGEGGDMEGHIGEDEEGVRVLRQLL